MGILELTFACGENSLSVRRFSVREAMSTLFEVSIVARSPHEEVDLDAIVGKSASFRIVSGLAHARLGARRWQGVCKRLEQIQAEERGLSTYELTIVPSFWLLTQRRNHRIFQRLSIPSIVDAILSEWEIKPTWRIDRASYPALEYRVQYGESDFAFTTRLLEEAGIAYFFADDDKDGTRLVLADRPQTAEIRPGLPIPCVDNPNEAAEREFVTKVRIAQEIRPGRYTVRDFDFRAKPSYQLLGAADPAPAPEDRYEQYHYVPGGFVDDKGAARDAEKAGRATATKGLEGVRASQREVAFRTNALDLAPGVVFAMAGHVRADLAPDKTLLVDRIELDGTEGGQWTMVGRAVFASRPYRPARRTEKPQIQGVQSALVVGPKGSEIHTDEYGRVRVQFHWDRHGAFNEQSSCWMRVSQGWAGGAYGMIAIPRVGHEVLVGFFEGDPDQPIVVGRVFNSATRVPYNLPEHQTVSTWKSDSSPGGGGFNELKFEDAKGKELVYVQAERDLEKLVKHDETETTGNNRSISVAVNRTTNVGAIDNTVVGALHSTHMLPLSGGVPTGWEMVDKRIHFTTGDASITLEGPNITLKAKGKIFVHSTDDDVELLGGPWVKINCGPAKEGESDTVTSHHITGIVRDQDGKPVADRKVVVRSSDGVIQQVVTDGTGRYFALVPAGKCEVRVPGTHRFHPTSTNFDEMNLDPESFDDSGPVG